MHNPGRQPKLVSVNMPVYNAEKYLGRAIESILCQTYSHFELIIVNDGSTDDSKNIIFSYNDPRIKYFENSVNQNIVKTRNRCLAESSGEYIAVLDSDDVSKPERLQEQIRFLEDNQEYGMCGTYYEIINANDELQYKMNVPVSDRDNKTFLNFNVCFCHSTVMMRSELANKFKFSEGFDIIEDYELAYKVSKVAKIANLPSYLTQYRVHGNNVTIEKKERMLALRKKMDESVLNDLGVNYSNSELEMHTNFINFNHEYFKDDLPLARLGKWLSSYYSYLKTKKKYNSNQIARSFSIRWFLICAKNKKYRQIVLSPLLLQFPLLYVYYLSNFLTEKYRNTHLVV